VAEKLVVMVSSTVLDLPQHREEVREACLQQEMFPDMMEYLAASSNDAIEVSLDKVDRADVYVGVFGHRYGYIPKGHTISITQMEYERAVDRNIDRLIFIMHDDHPIRIGDIDFEHHSQLTSLKERLASENTINFFKSPADLRALVVNSLSHFRYKRDEAKLQDADRFKEFVEHADLSEMMKESLRSVGAPALDQNGGDDE
jgi:hypothetical protein